jgi:serine/threonine protein phosphatase 1
MKYLVIGDIHGCYYTLMDLLTKHSNSFEKIIFVGDLIDRGAYSADVYLFCRNLVEGGKAIVLKGNHEKIFTNHFSGKEINENWEQHEGRNTLKSFKVKNIDPTEFLDWADKLPLCHFTDNFVVSHAGFCDTPENRNIILNKDQRDSLVKNVNQDDSKSMLWSREDCIKLNIPQIHGHTPMPNAGPLYCSSSNVYNIDTGACFGWFLSALIIDEINFKPIFIPTNIKDLAL